MRVTGSGSSDRGRRRESNEDTWFADDELGLYVVCDGMGGHQAGEVASALAIEAVVDMVRAARTEQRLSSSKEEDFRALTELTEAAVLHACRVVHRAATDDLSRAGMGCTLTLLLVSGSRAVMGHVGDTRLYLIREGLAHQLSNDHTMAADLARAGIIPWAQVKTHQFAHVLTRSIGAHPAVTMDTLSIQLLPGDRLVLCSDGLSDYLPDTTRLEAVSQQSALEQVPTALIKLANDSGGRDNITVVALDATSAAARSEVTLSAQDTRSRLDTLTSTPFANDEFLAHLLRLVHATDVREFEDGSSVVTVGATTGTLYFPIQGTLRVSAPGGKSRDVRRGEVLGESTVLRPRPALATVTAHDRCRTLAIDSAALRALVRQEPWFGLEILEVLGVHLSEELDRSHQEVEPTPML